MINLINICNRKLLVNSLQEVDLLQANSNYSLLHELIKALHKDKQPHSPLVLLYYSEPGLD